MLARLPALRVWRRPRWRQGQALRVALAGSGPALTPAPGGAFKAMPGAGRGTGVEGFVQGWAGAVGCADFGLCFSYFIGKTACVERIFEYNREHATRGLNSNDARTAQSAG